MISRKHFLKTIVWGVLVSSSLNAQATNQSSIQIPEKENSQRSYIPNGKLYFAMYGRQLEDKFAKTSQGVAVINPEFEVKYGDRLTLGLDFAAIIGTGNASSFWNDDGKAPNSILLSEVFAKINVYENIFVKAGAIETTINPLGSIMSGMTFIGAQEEWQIGANSSNITLTAYQAVPSSGSVSRRLYDEGSQAYFLSQTVAGKLKQESTGSEFKLAATRFQFENLSTNVANDSSLLGNSLAAFEGTAKAFRFKYGFMGTEIAGNFSQEIGPVDLTLRASQIVNDQAPEATNKGKQYGAQIKYTQGNVVLKPGYTVFDYDADVTPVTYTLVTSRYQNRTGNKISMDIELKKEKLALRTYYLNMIEKEDNPYLADREVYNVLLEAKYDIF